MILKESIEKLMRHQHLDRLTCQQVLDEILNPATDELQIAAFLVLLRSKPETAEELAAFVSALKNKMIPVLTPHPILDIVGTGGDGLRTVNISTGSAILAASCGIKIAKHGNRAVSSLAGSADVLAALGLNIHLTPEKIAASIDEIGIGFCLSPNFHPAMQQLRQLRKQLNIPTTFNLLGPLLNPANPSHYLIGVYDKNLLPFMANALNHIGTKRSMIVHGSGMDEMSCIAPIHVCEIHDNHITENIIDPQTLGLARCGLSDLQGGDANCNAELLRNALTPTVSKKFPAIRDTLILNAAVALYLYGRHDSIENGILHARDQIMNGAALTLLKRWIEFSHESA